MSNDNKFVSYNVLVLEYIIKWGSLEGGFLVMRRYFASQNVLVVNITKYKGY